MRILNGFEKKKRGCIYCADVEQVHHGYHGLRNTCPHDKCPYKVLDKYKTYEQFMASEDSKILVPSFFQADAACYELQRETSSIKDVFRGACSNPRLNF